MKAVLAGKNNSYNRASESCCKTPSNLCAKRDHPSNINHNVNFIYFIFFYFFFSEIQLIKSISINDKSKLNLK
jgi:hypothetical protein